MDAFERRQGGLHCEQVDLERVARDVGTPCYVYSHRALVEGLRSWREAFASVPHVVAFALKACPTVAVVRALAAEGGGAEVVSLGELHRAARAAVPPERCVFSGVGKSRAEMEAALRAHVLLISVESEAELDELATVAAGLDVRAPVALRVNPDVDARTHPHIATGLEKNKFGVPAARAEELYRRITDSPHLEAAGIHSHIGSQITEPGPFMDTLERMSALLADLRSAGIALPYWNIGGGLGVAYHDEQPPTPADLAALVTPLLEGSGCTIILEPGRSIAAPAGVLLTRVVRLKEGAERSFAIVDAGMNDLLRPALYDAWHAIEPVAAPREERATVDVVGPLCESGDFLARQRDLPRLRAGDLLAVRDAGAYGSSMASNYNSRPRPAEVLVSGSRQHVIRRREQLEDLTRDEEIPGFL